MKHWPLSGNYNDIWKANIWHNFIMQHNVPHPQIAVVADKVGISPELICSGSRQRKYSEARALVAYLAVEETGHTAAEVARFLGVKRMSVHQAIIRGKTLRAKFSFMREEDE